jgi:hypothetical protein
MTDALEVQRIKAANTKLTQQIQALNERLTTNTQTLKDAITAVNQNIGPLIAAIPQDITITWPNPWPDTGYGIWTQIATGNAVLGQIHATLKANSKTETECVVTVLAAVAVTSAGLDVIGART